MLCIIFLHTKLGIKEYQYCHVASHIFLKHEIKRDSDVPESSGWKQGLRQGKCSLLDYKNCFLILFNWIHIRADVFEEIYLKTEQKTA